MRWNALALRGERPWLARDHLRNDRLRSRARERRIASEHLVGYRAERVDVGSRSDVALAHRLLGAHVLRSAERETRLCHALAASLFHGERDSKIGHECMTVLKENVLRLDVAVHDAAAVRIIERVGGFARYSNGIRYGKLLVTIQSTAERLTFHVRHDIVQQAIRASAVEQRKNMRMLKVGGEFYFF